MPSSARRLGIGVACLAFSVARPSAHRLDEVLQAARIAIEADHVQVEVSVTAGQLIAERWLRTIDADRDGLLSAAEQERHVRQVQAGLTMTVDGEPPLTLTPVEARFPTAEAMRSGDAAVTIRAEARLGSLAVGRHRLTFRNDHQPEGSVYLANALVPSTDRVAVTAQHRDTDQRELTIDFDRRPDADGSVTPAWMVVGALTALVPLVGWGVRRTRRPAWAA